MASLNTYLELNNYNANEDEIQATVKYSGKNLLSDEHSKVWPYKFKINSNNFPLHIPTIVNNFTPYNVGTTVPIINNPENYYLTDWVITIKMKNTNAKSAPVRWIKDGYKQVLTGDLFKNKYFWVNNSDEIAININDCFASLLSDPLKIFIVKQGDRWMLLIDSDLMDNIEGIYFNDYMRKYFSFDYGANNKITLSKLQTHTVLETIYFTITTPNSNNKLFPFDKVIFKSEKLNVPALSIQNYDARIVNNSAAVLLSYDLSISDISEISTSMSYINNTKDRSLSLIGPFPDFFEINCYLVTKSGYEFQLMLKQDDKITISLMFF